MASPVPLILLPSSAFKNIPMSELKAIVVDWAGTVIDFGSCAPVQAFVGAFRQCEVEISSEEARRPMGAAKLDHIRQILAMPTVAQRWLAARGKPPADADAQEIYRRFLPLQLDILDQYAKLIPGTLAMQDYCRSRGMKIGSSTGYVQELMDVLVPLAREQGFQPDAMVCTNDVPIGRPAPWLNLENLRRLNVYPARLTVAVDDTLVGVRAGINAGMWTIGISRTGNEVGLSEAEAVALPPAELNQRITRAAERLTAAGAHFVAESMGDVPNLLKEIEHRLQSGAKP
jgi:phosphonoacetaldehyde hydrolase